MKPAANASTANTAQRQLLRGREYGSEEFGFVCMK
jgi:hypothetical protein